MRFERSLIETLHRHPAVRRFTPLIGDADLIGSGIIISNRNNMTAVVNRWERSRQAMIERAMIGKDSDW